MPKAQVTVLMRWACRAAAVWQENATEEATVLKVQVTGLMRWVCRAAAAWQGKVTGADTVPKAQVSGMVHSASMQVNGKQRG